MTGFAGFDVSAFPGWPTLAWLKAETNLSWVGFYLRAPSHPESGWSGTRAGLVSRGWGISPIFVGQQIAGPGSHNVTMLQGTNDGLAAAGRMAVEGFPEGSACFLDLENGPPFAAPQTNYVHAWCAAMRLNGWVPGVYCSHLMAEDVAAANPGSPIWAFKIEASPSAAAPFSTEAPSGCGFAEAVAWQYRQNATIDVDGQRLKVDLSVATSSDPSAPLA